MNAIQSCQYLVSTAITSSMHVAYAGAGVMAAALLLRIVSSIYRTNQAKKKLLSQAVPLPEKVLEICRAQHLPIDQVSVVKNKAMLAACVGFINPKIVISTTAINKLSSGELEAVLLHEYFHSKGFHPLLITAAALIKKALVLFPVLDDAAGYLSCRLECAADKYVIEKQKTNSNIKTAMKHFLLMRKAETHIYAANFAAGHLRQRIAAMQGQAINYEFSVLRLCASLLSAAALFSLIHFAPSAAAARNHSIHQMAGLQCSVATCVSDCVQYQRSLANWHSADMEPKQTMLRYNSY